MKCFLKNFTLSSIALNSQNTHFPLISLCVFVHNNFLRDFKSVVCKEALWKTVNAIPLTLKWAHLPWTWYLFLMILSTASSVECIASEEKWQVALLPDWGLEARDGPAKPLLGSGKKSWRSNGKRFSPNLLIPPSKKERSALLVLDDLAAIWGKFKVKSDRKPEGSVQPKMTERTIIYSKDFITSPESAHPF